MDDNNREFNEILASRVLPPMRSNLEHRIITAAHAGRVARQERGFWAGVQAVWDEFFDDLLIPLPKVSMVLLLLFALMLGVYGDLSFVSDSGAEDMALYMDFANNAGFGGAL